MAHPFPADAPRHDELADLLDVDDWNPVLHGRFKDYADLPEPAVEVHEQEVSPGALHDAPPA